MFGPYYPPALQRAINHAEKLCQLLALPETAASLDVWNIGRSDEIARFIELVVCDWIDERLGETAAANEIDAYLEGLHEGIRRHLAITHLPCCPDTINRLPSVSDVFPSADSTRAHRSEDSSFEAKTAKSKR